MMFCGVPYLIGYLALSYAHFASTVSVFNGILLFGRFSTGFGMGWTSAVCPVRVCLTLLSKISTVR